MSSMNFESSSRTSSFSFGELARPSSIRSRSSSDSVL